MNTVIVSRLVDGVFTLMSMGWNRDMIGSEIRRLEDQGMTPADITDHIDGLCAKAKAQAHADNEQSPG